MTYEKTAAYLLDETNKQIELFNEVIIIDNRQYLKFFDNGDTINDLKSAGKYTQNVIDLIVEEAAKLGVVIENDVLIIYPDETKYIDMTTQGSRLAQLIATVRRMVFLGYIQ